MDAQTACSETNILGIVSRGRRYKPIPMASGKDQALVDALTIVVHDLRGPLANLQVMLELIEVYAARKAFVEVPDCARRAQTIIETLDAMLSGFLERARQTGDPLAFRPALTDLNDITADAAALSAPLAQSRTVEIERHGRRPVTLDADRRLVLEAVDNILGNAVKYSPPGSSVALVTGVDGRDAVISVTDSGPGFSEHELAGLFRPFASLSRRKPGIAPSTGLGLWIARLIATRHGGSLTVVPRRDAQGSVFTLRLPRRT
ncbi:MAG: HAMP domain-containing sensor histidine kinase [Hyphomicrobiaceae bacterium]